ncbi:MAG: AbrB/MazE/SpoVT family DNA-binding domain-containing protein [Myxococcales bacterium]|nr:AbrB/MazE/SpoVT family DNA-binding domain-containing protein [Myxococcales bacterium]
MVTKLRAIGDALGVIIEPELLDQVAIDRDTPLEIHVEGQTLVIRPSRASLRERVRAINAEMMEIHAETLRRLAE